MDFIPNLKLAQARFALLHGDAETKAAAKELIYTQIKKKNMAPFYESLCADNKLELNLEILTQFQQQNQQELASKQEKLTDAEKTAGSTEISEALIAKADYLAQIGHNKQAVDAYMEAFEKTPGLGAKIDLLFSVIRVGFFFNDRNVIVENLEKVKTMIEQGGDWDRRNRCKVYEATYLMSMREFAQATPLFLETIATFTSLELMTNAEFLLYTVLCAVFSLGRTEMKEKVIDCPEIHEFILQVPHLQEFMCSLFECKYNVFFETLAHMEDNMKRNMYLYPHYKFFVREMRIKAYAQLLESYQSLSLEYMANAFGVTTAFIDADLFRFISNSRLNCVIDKVRGVVETNRPDNKNYQYQQLIKQGDIVLNKAQNLSRIISI